MASDRALDPAAVLAALGIADAASITPVTGGTATALWRVERGASTYALRVFRADQAEACQRELAAMEAARAAQLPVPPIHAHGLWHDRPALLLAWCPGVPVAQLLLRQPWRVGALGAAFGATQAQIHQVQAPAQLARQHGDWISWAGPIERTLRARLERAAGSAAALLHLDYHMLNVLCDGRRITGVLDWANARAGDPRADVARTYTILMVEPYGPRRQSLTLTIFRRLFARSWRRGYEQVAGPLPDLAPFYAWAGAAMVHDLAPRVDDPRSWWQERHLRQIEAWAAQWRRRAEQGE